MRAAPLPSLRLALSRRSAIFGAVTLAGVPAAVTCDAPRWDADLVALEPVPDDEREAHNERLDHADTILARMAELDATSREGLCAKAAAFEFSAGFDLQEGWDVGHSLALDILRLGRAAG